ncbi:unnamed protein product [Phytomonas sp. EM1]|nr:unnamed protein product [Phytomonas sp. EM1]|eukprot:CCW63584.1 unnamed protein product [Phytomonas sp. isolate EM1]
MKYFDGIEPPSAFAHAPQLIDREVFARLVENELRSLPHVKRLAYEREMFPFLPVGAYGFFPVTMARDETKRGGCPETCRTWLQQIQRSLDIELNRFPINFGPKSMPSFKNLSPVYGSARSMCGFRIETASASWASGKFPRSSRTTRRGTVSGHYL